MERRQSLKSILFMAANVAATPALLQLLSSCEAKVGLDWQPLFLNNEQAYAVEQIADVILPQTSLPSASTVNTPQFLDLVLNDIVDEKTQQVFLKGATVFSEKFKELFKKQVLKGTQNDFQNIIKVYFEVDETTAEQVVALANSNEGDIIANDTYYLYKYLLFIRYYTLFAYTTSQELQEQVFKYNPYSPTFVPCTPFSEH